MFQLDLAKKKKRKKKKIKNLTIIEYPSNFLEINK